MDSSTKPTVVFVPGVFHTPVHAEVLVECLRTKGYPTEVVSHPTIGTLAASAPPNADAAHLRQVLEELVNNQQKEIILLCHSYGGVPGSQSVNGLEISSRARASQKGGIVKTIFLSAVIPREGDTVVQTLVGSEIPPGEWIDRDPATGVSFVNAKASATLFHDLPADRAEYYVSKLEPMSAHVVSVPVSNVCWDNDVPKVAIFCKTDRVFPLDGQRRMMERVKSTKGGDWETYEMDCGHSPFLSHVEELVEIITLTKA
ncbi:AB hydrolase-1 domain-containing protein [Mycena sanguinolenta]|uniref:AB hydrolase-1 domain-containing protein n=1 Tax=Mycena sanguinolenta TaxID=230812 RepID=A0A8H6ZFJ7_9AGAR|nr:AB hydrolase-1 domain-containing protein [Mycena sanguinolenta]